MDCRYMSLASIGHQLTNLVACVNDIRNPEENIDSVTGWIVVCFSIFLFLLGDITNIQFHSIQPHVLYDDDGAGGEGS
jgi:hypothetical protein